LQTAKEIAVALALVAAAPAWATDYSAPLRRESLFATDAGS
jgi:hypothetical protein